MAGILQSLIDASEKAASIARACIGVGEESLLIAEKSGGDANARFDRDFKTIADVLAQKSAKQVIVSNYPGLDPHIRGEECEEIGGTEIKILSTVAKTTELLNSLVSLSLAVRMAEAAHGDIKCTIPYLPDVPEVDVSDLGIWIDPIDATAEFIAGVRGDAEAGRGLGCVTVLIGAYRRSTGDPIMGVINQPFHNGGKGRVVWGIDVNGSRKWGGTHVNCTQSSNIVLLSNAENPEIKEKLINSLYAIDIAPGAGYKLMNVCLGQADSYILSKGTTFLWDTCAPHAILRAKGGDIVNFSTQESIKYNIPQSNDNGQYCNAGGIIAFNNKDTVHEMISILQ